MTPKILQTNAEDVAIENHALDVHQLALLDLLSKNILFAEVGSTQHNW